MTASHQRIEDVCYAEQTITYPRPKHKLKIIFGSFDFSKKYEWKTAVSLLFKKAVTHAHFIHSIHSRSLQCRVLYNKTFEKFTTFETYNIVNIW